MKASKLTIICFLIFNASLFAADITFNGSSLTTDFHEKDSSFINKHWRFSVGDNLQWANPHFDDRNWDTLYLPFIIEELFPFKFNGNVWIRSTFTISKEDVLKTLYLNIKQFGASEIYIDGKLLSQFGKINFSKNTEESYNPSGNLIPFIIDSIGIHHIAVRYSNHHILKKNMNEAEMDAFDLEILREKAALSTQTIRFYKSIGIATGIGIFLTLSIINFILFIFYKRDKSNLYYSLFSLTITGSFIINAISQNCYFASTEFLFDQVNEAFQFISNFFLVALVYSFAYKTNPKRLYALLIIILIGVALIPIKFDYAATLSDILSIYCVIDVVVVLLKLYSVKYDPTRKKRKKVFLIIASLIALASLSLFFGKIFFIITMVTLVILIIIPIAGIIFIVPLYMTVRHARSFALTNASLEEQLVQVKELSEKAILQEQEKKKILETQNELLEQMVDERTAELAEKNLEIKDSINYALRIQKAILTSKEEINEGLKNCFILFKPKDIVSGDFYFYSKTKNQIIIAAADCTGHGVPGALMSMIGSEKLMSTANESHSPSVILNSLNKGIKSSLRQSDKEESTKDGMDIALVSINSENNIASYAGANRPIWIIRNKSDNESFEVEEIKATKKAIGGFTEDDQHFQQHELQFNKGDTFYLFTDGYADQFGHTGKKLMTKKFREILIEIQHLTMDEQEKYLNDFIEGWKKGADQVDDILVIGVRI